MPASSAREVRGETPTPEHDQIGIDGTSLADFNLVVENLLRFGIEQESDPVLLVKLLDKAGPVLCPEYFRAERSPD